MKIDLLDHGYAELIESWGSDERIIESARMSTGKGFLGWGRLTCSCGASSETGRLPNTRCPTERGGAHVVQEPKAMGDEKLLRFLWEHKHSTPFEMAGLTIEVQAPIMVFREWHRHRTQSYSELSARYTPLPDVNYMPTVDRLLMLNTTNKQATSLLGAETLTLDSALEWLAELADVYEHAERVYQSGLRRGVPKELARLPVPVGRYSRMRASANLRNWLGFEALRLPANAQWEIRQFAGAVGTMIGGCFPRTWALFSETSAP